MKFKYSGFGKIVGLITFSVLSLLVYSSSIGIALGQKKPTTLKLDVDIDDMQLCNGSSNISGSQFCVLYRSYYSKLNSGNFAGAQADRNEMIEIVRGQVDTFYKQRKDGRSSKIRIFQTVLDFLRIGGELAVTIMNGERAKTIVGAALSGLNSGQSAFNKNFQILQTQVLINKMNANRAELMTKILTKKSLGPGDYSWYAAKNDLRDYLFAGTFDNALDSLVEETGAEVREAKRNLDAVSQEGVAAARRANDTLEALRKSLDDNATKDEATRILRAVVTTLMKDAEIGPLLSQKQITAASDGNAIWEALFDLRGDLIMDGRSDLVIKINTAIIEAAQ